MRRWEKYAFNSLAMLISVSGVAYGWMKYLVQSDDPFAVVNHPLQPLMLHAHVLAAPVLLVVFGIVFNSHVGRKVGGQVANRRSGLVSLMSMVVMTASGYLLQVTTADGLRHAWLVLHLLSGGFFVLAYSIHMIISARMWLGSAGLHQTFVA